MEDLAIVPTAFEKLKILAGYLTRRNTRKGALSNISKHYDLGNDFYAMFLDEALHYTCAYFTNADDDLETAQRQKADLVCRKLRLQPGDSVVEAGCGWGGFALHAAEHYGVSIRSYNISKEQVALARQRAEARGLSRGQVEYVEEDYRNIGTDGRVYDKFVSIGMLEHVGRENHRELFDIIHRVTKPDGLALVHSIGRIAAIPTDPWLEKYIFPGCYIPALSEMVKATEKVDRRLHIADAENLRLHYALTLDHWFARFEEHAHEILDMFDEVFVRMFRLYLRSAAAGFRYGNLMLFQLLLVNGFPEEMPLTREYMFSWPGAADAVVPGVRRPAASPTLEAGGAP
jgi:cyclopropane-fatty-acyl-phospholipid synthase